MQTHKAQRILLSVLIPAGVILSTAIVLLETAFFHINPFKPGFNRFDFGECVMLAAELPAGNDYGIISTTMAENEAALGLHYRSKVQIILCEKQLDLNRFQPFLSAADKRNAVAVAPWPNTIYLTPKAKEEYGSISVPLGHEL